MENTSAYHLHRNATAKHRHRTYAVGGASSSGSGGGGGKGNGKEEMTRIPSVSLSFSDNDRSSSELRELDCNLTALCEHVQLEGFNSGAFSDVIVHAMGSTYHLHRLILSRSTYFRNMLQGPWKEANAPVLALHVDDKNVNDEAIAIALSYLYGHYPKLCDSNAFRVLAAASFLDLQDLCAICTDFIISELQTSNFLAYQVFAESQDYGLHGAQVKNACWGYLSQSGAVELKEVLSKLSPQTLHALLTSDELWVLSEEKRFELALFTFLANSSHSEGEHELGTSSADLGTSCDSSSDKGNDLADGKLKKMLESGSGCMTLEDEPQSRKAANGISGERTTNTVDCCVTKLNCREQLQQSACLLSNLQSQNDCSIGQLSPSGSFSFASEMRNSCSYGVGVNTLRDGCVVMEGPSQEDPYYQSNNYSWLPGDQPNSMSVSSSSYMFESNECGRSNTPSVSWGGRIVGRREVKTCLKQLTGMSREEFDTFVNIFEGGSLLYCNMSFEALLNVRKQLEEMGFPCKAVNDGLWLQMLLSQRVQEIAADTCKNCCLVSMACTCRQPFGYSRGIANSGYYMQNHDQDNPSDLENVYIANYPQGEGNGLFRPIRVHVRGPIDGLAGIGCGTTFVPAAAWPPTRFVFSRVPLGMGSRNGQQYPGTDDLENRADHNGDLAGDGLTALVGLSQGAGSISNFQEEQSERGYETDKQSRMVGTSMAGPTSSGIPVQMLDSPVAVGVEWDNTNGSSISLDIRTPLCHFPPFRFGVEFEDVHRLNDGQVKHSPEVFYAGSLWKVSAQAFSDEDPQGRRTLGLFLHRRKAEITDSVKKVYTYVDPREKVTARYQLICPSKREVMVFGSFKQSGTLLPKAPKGWGWRTALLFDELGDFLQNGNLRVAAVVQLV